MRKVLMVFVLLIAVAGCTKAPPPYTSKVSATESSTTASAVANTQRQPFDAPTAIGRALESDQPYVISVIGDSTGNAPDEWVHLVMRRVAESYRRTITIHDWDTPSNAYATDTVYGSGGAPVTVWNGSAAGKSAAYSLDHFPQLAPDPVNLTIISHGHNSPEDEPFDIPQLVDRAYDHTLPGGGVVVILQNPRLDTGAQARADVVEQLRQTYSDPSTGVFVADVNAAFKAAPDLAPLLRPDGIHPNQQGSRVWADAFASIMQLR